jgi:TrmH family RNA methyltransferase
MRDRDRRFLVEGAQGVLEALRSGVRVSEVFHTGPVPAEIGEAAATAVALLEVSDAVMEHLTSTVTPQGLLAVADFVDTGLDAVGDRGMVPVLWAVRDPGNAGTILRSADAAGVAGVVFTASSVDVYNPKTVRASAGSVFHLPVVRGIDPASAVVDLRRRGFRVLAASADGTESVHEVDLTAPSAVLLGNEASGLPQEARAMADTSVRVPIQGSAESLNLAAAATVILFEAARQRSASAGLAAVVAGAAHDLRSPLTALRGFSSTLVSRWDRLTDDQRLMMLEGIEHDAVRMDVIVTQLADAARIESNALTLALEPVDLRDLASAVAADVSRWGAVDVRAEVPPEPVRVRADRARIRLILLALVEGANWWGEEGPVTIEVRSESGPTVLVRRRGSTLERDGAPFVFGARAPGTGGGSKVGLYVAKALAEAHGGTLAIEVDGETRFRLSVPGSEPR